MTLTGGTVAINWPIAVLVAINLAVIGFVFGSAYKSAYDDARISWMLGENRRLATALRMLYAGTGFEWPDLCDEDDQPQPGWWDRAVRWLRGQQRDEVIGAEEFEARAEEDERGVTKVPSVDDNIGTIVPAVHDDIGIVVDAEPDPDDTDPRGFPPLPGPETQPDMKRAATVAPLPVDSYEQWKRDFDARAAADLEAIRQLAR